MIAHKLITDALYDALLPLESKCLDNVYDQADVVEAAARCFERLLIDQKLVLLCERIGCGTPLRGTYWQMPMHGNVCNDCHHLLITDVRDARQKEIPQ